MEREHYALPTEDVCIKTDPDGNESFAYIIQSGEATSSCRLPPETPPVPPEEHTSLPTAAFPAAPGSDPQLLDRFFRAAKDLADLYFP